MKARREKVRSGHLRDATLLNTKLVHDVCLLEKGAKTHKEEAERMETFSFREPRSTEAPRQWKLSKREPARREPPRSERSLSRSHSHHHSTSPSSLDLEADMEPQTLSEAARKWFRQNGLEGFLAIMEAPPHREADRVIKELATEVITEEAIRALTGLPEGGIFQIDNPTSEQLTRYFGEYSVAGKGYRTQGGEDPLFREIARVLHEYGHVYPRPPVMPKNRAGMIIATYEGVKVDWPVLIADGLCMAIDMVRGKDGKEGRKLWHAVAQWITLLVPPVETVQPKKRPRVSEGSTSKPASKRQQLLASKATKGKKRVPEPEEVSPVRPVKITLRRPGQKEPEPLTAQKHAVTQEEETEEPEEHLQRRSRSRTAETGGERSYPREAETPPTQPEQTTREEPEPVRREPVLSTSIEEVSPTAPETARTGTQQPASPASTHGGQGVGPVQQQGTSSMWLRWVGEQIAGAVEYIEAEERAHHERLLVTTVDLETARSRIRSLEQDLDRVTRETQVQAPVTPGNVQNKASDQPVHSNQTPATETVPERNAAQAQELADLKDELAAQEALRSRERELKTAAEAELKKTAENLRRAEESLRKGHQAYDRLKEEKEKMLQEKERLRRNAETEVERLKEELRQVKDREDRNHRQINGKLKQKTEEFEQLHREYKRLQTEHKERTDELRQAVDRTATAYANEQAETRRRLEEAEKVRTELLRQQQAEKERAAEVLQRLQTTYQGQLTRYREQAEDTANLIKQLKEERQVVESRAQMGASRIQDIMRAWLNQTKSLIDNGSVKWWTKWATNAAELQLLRADVENRRKEGDDCYMLTSEDFTGIRDELAEDFQALAEDQLEQVRQLVAQLDDDRLEAQIQFESYERSRIRGEKEREPVTVNLSDEEPLLEGDRTGSSQTEMPEPERQTEQPESAKQTEQQQQVEQPEQPQSQPQPQQQQQAQPQQPQPEEQLETLEQSILDNLGEQ